MRKLFRKIFPVNQQLNYFARGNLFEILMRSLYGAQIRVAEASCRMADLVLRPNICDDRWLDYRHPGKFIQLGREEAECHLEEIRALVAGKEALRDRFTGADVPKRWIHGAGCRGGCVPGDQKPEAHGRDGENSRRVAAKSTVQGAPRQDA